MVPRARGLAEDRCGRAAVQIIERRPLRDAPRVIDGALPADLPLPDALRASRAARAYQVESNDGAGASRGLGRHVDARDEELRRLNRFEPVQERRQGAAEAGTSECHLLRHAAGAHDLELRIAAE